MTGIITEIQRFSLNDGPGIRTTVFFKGCNMNCLWCHNPETISPLPELMYYAQKCIGCGACFKVCPTGAHKTVNGAHVVDRDLCTDCGKCAEECFAEALVMSGRKMGTDQVMKEILQDKPYYDESGGGVTFSGGEALCSIGFAEEITDACHASGVNVAVETNLNMPFGYIERFLKKMDLVMTDIKLFDNDMHLKYTGAGNSTILENIKKLSRTGIPMIVRTPLIPGITDADENIIEIALFLGEAVKMKECGIMYYELLNYNPLGDSKFTGMGKDNQLRDKRPLPQERLDEIEAMLDNLNTGLKIKVS